MDQNIKEAIMIEKEACEKICSLVNQFSDNPDSVDESMPKAQILYQLAAEMQVKASQLTDCKEVYEGACRINNARATVEIGGFEIRGDIAFEIQMDGKWVKGHRENSQYGQCFIGKDGASMVLTEQMIGRVTHPLEMDC